MAKKLVLMAKEKNLPASKGNKKQQPVYVCLQPVANVEAKSNE